MVQPNSGAGRDQGHSGFIPDMNDSTYVRAGLLVFPRLRFAYRSEDESMVVCIDLYLKHVSGSDADSAYDGVYSTKLYQYDRFFGGTLLHSLSSRVPNTTFL